MKRKERSPEAAAENRQKKSKTEGSSESSPSKLDFATPEKVLQSLLSPTNLRTFFSDYWEKKPLVIKRQDSAFYGSLFLKKQLEDILKTHKLKYEEDVNVCLYVDGKKELHNGAGRATVGAVEKAVKASGATVQFHQPQRFKDDLWQLNAALEQYFGALVGANVYITPSKAQGLAPHHDDIEAFVLQLEGTKHWKLYEPHEELSMNYSPDLERDSIGEPTHEFDLEPGDLLYFPRGTIHEAQATGDGNYSTHVTISTYQRNTWGDFLLNGDVLLPVAESNLEQIMQNDVEFRRGLPINYRAYMGYQFKREDEGESTGAVNGVETEHNNSDELALEKKRHDFHSQLSKLIGRMADHFDSDEAVDCLIADFMASRLPPFSKKDEVEEKGQDEAAPTDDNSIRLLYHDHVRLLMMQKTPEIDDEDEDSDGMSVDEEEESSEEAEVDEQRTAGKKGDSHGGRKADQSGDKKEGGESDEEKPTAKRKRQEREEKTNETGAKQESRGSKEETGDEDEDGDEDGDESSKDDGEDEEDGGKEWLIVSHSVNNDRTRHMIGDQQPSAVKFPVMCKAALRHILSRPGEYIPVSALPLPEEERVALVTSLWAERLIEKI